MQKKLLVSSVGAAGLLAVSITAFASSLNWHTERENIECPETEITIPSATEAVEITATAERTEKTETVEIEEAEPEYISKIGSMDWDGEDAYLLAKIAMAEAEDQDTEGKALVILVVLNRVWDKRFPDTIREVIYQKNQFSPISNGRFDRVEPDADCWAAVDLVQIEHWDESCGALYFESKSASTWHEDNLQFLFQHGAHLFYTERGE